MISGKGSTERFPLSKSGREVYESCPRKWYFKYRAKVPSQPTKPDGRAFGITIHKILEHPPVMNWEGIEKLVKEVEPGTDLTKLDKDFRQAFETRLDSLVEPLRPKLYTAVQQTIEELASNGEVWEVDNDLEQVLLANAFWTMYHLHKRGTKLQGVELKINIEDWLSGYIDAIELASDGYWYLTDYKFFAPVSKPPPDALIYDTQIRLYESSKDLVAEKLKLDPSKYRGFLYTVCVKRVLKPIKATTKRAAEGQAEFVYRCYPQVETTYIAPNEEITQEVADIHKAVHGEIMGKGCEVSKFPRCRTSCKGKYGLCQYYSLCNSTEHTAILVLDNQNAHLMNQLVTNLLQCADTVLENIEIDL